MSGPQDHRITTTTSSSATTKPVARKITPTASKTWKENLRRACLERARQRQRRRPSSNNNHDDDDNEDSSNMMMMVPAVRQMVEEELRQRSIAVRAPCFSDEPEPTNELSSMAMMDSDEQSNEIVVPKAQHFISEEELLELLEEMEQEMEREQASLVDDMLQRAENERQYLEEQVLDFQQWEEMHQHQDDAVPCPVCHEENLMFSGDGTMIVCPNSMDGSCSCSLQLCNNNTNNNLRTLHDLQDKLRQAYEEHSLHCHHFLTFSSQNGHLQASCSACSGSLQLV